MKLVFLFLLFPVLSVYAQSKLDVKIAEETKQITCTPPDEAMPVTLNARLVNESDSIGIIVKVSIAPGWHIYAHVPQTQPYIAIDQIRQLPENYRAVGEWKKTEPHSTSNDPGVLIYEGEAVFIRKVVKLSPAATGVIKAGLYYQTCNLRQCLPPEEKTMELKIM